MTSRLFVKKMLKDAFLGFFTRVIENEEVQTIIYKNLKRPINFKNYDLSNIGIHYKYINADSLRTFQFHDSKRDDVIIITARFRSGSTLLWNIFRNIDGMTSYYEPFNERRWFDKSGRGDRIDTTHKHVDDYWREYDNLEILADYYQINWIDKNLFMDESFWAPEMKRYVELMIDHAPGRPVLQFNRIDFRLPWFRKHFPWATIVHLYRNPRDQWCSSLMALDSFPKTAPMHAFEPHDHFYLRRWARDLRYHFPFLDESSLSHPYQMFYYIWKLSYLFGVKFSHISLAYEDLLNNPDRSLLELFEKINIKQYDIDRLKNLIVRPRLDPWKSYADDEWFRYHEAVCERVLADFLSDDVPV